MPESFDYVYQAIKTDVQLASISGGTDIVSCFVLGNPAGPVRRGEIQMRGLGMAVEVCDDAGKPVGGQKGELVCTRPFPCMPVSFWNDPDGQRYHDTYFARFPGVWCHGDFAELTRARRRRHPRPLRCGAQSGRGADRHRRDLPPGRADPGGAGGDLRRPGLAGRRPRRAVRAPAPRQTLDAALEQRIKRRSASNCTPRHVPARIVAVADIPRTRSGKITELAVRDVIHGRAVKNTEALANPDALELYRDLAELQA